MEKTSILITGANMENLSIKKAGFKDLEVRAFVTAGVQSNAMRMGKSEGAYYEPETKPGTINIILMTNMRLSERAMTRAVITATEAKTAALLDMDIRTSYDNGKYKATGTGTDNVLVLEGTGALLENTGGHTKLGEMMASVVYEGVKEAVFKQNGLSARRHIFMRLKERGISIYDLIASNKICEFRQDKARTVGEVEELLLDPRYAGFIQMALTVSDDFEKGLIRDLSAFEGFAQEIAGEISECGIAEFKPMIKKELPIVIKTGFNALLNGIHYRRDNP
jgi:adenosylcobinamide amidohydrolase